MPFHFTCPYCYKKTLVDETIAGETGPCAGCGKEVTIPIETPASAEGAYPVGDRYVPTPAEESNGKLTAWLLKSAGLAILVAILSSVAIFVFWPVFQRLKQQRDTVACMNNLQQIAIALNAYAAEFGTYPPPTVYDSAGKPLHSWRVLLLNHIGEEALYARYNFDEPWDSIQNSALFTDCPNIYISPATGDPFATESTYMLVTGNGTMFPKSGPLGPADVLDGTDRTLLVVEVTNGANEWTKPMDLDFGKLNHKIGAMGPNSIGGNHPDGATAVFANGDSAWIRGDLEPVLLDAVISPRGGEPIEPEAFEYR